jgi:perosamine synthetase
MNPKRRYWHDVVGYNYRMTNLQAALGVAQLNKIDRLIRRRRRMARAYARVLKGTPGLTLAPEMSWAKSVYWMYGILVPNSLRDRTIRVLATRGIETRPFFYPIHALPPYKVGLELPVAEAVSSSGLSLPSGARISEDQIEETAENLVLALRGSASA